MRIFLITACSLIALYIGSFHALVLISGYSAWRGAATGDELTIVCERRSYPRTDPSRILTGIWPIYEPLALVEARLSAHRPPSGSPWTEAWKTARAGHWRHFSRSPADGTGKGLLLSDLARLPPASDEGSRVLTSVWVSEEAAGWWIDLRDGGQTWCYRLDRTTLTLIGMK